MASSSSSWGAAASSDTMMEEDDDDNNATAPTSAATSSSTTTSSVEDQLGLLQQQLSCLRTNDKDVLVGQFQKIIGPSLSPYAAQFFLDMNNWNVQLAVGSYFDLIGSSGGGQQQLQFAEGGITPSLYSRMPPHHSSSTMIPQVVVDPPETCLLRGTTSSYAVNVLSITSTSSSSSSSQTSPSPSNVLVLHSAPGRRITVKVVVENCGGVGDVPWPVGTRLAFVSGNANIVCDHESNNFTKTPVNPLEVVELELVLLVPLSTVVPSEIVMEFRLATPDGLIFDTEQQQQQQLSSLPLQHVSSTSVNIRLEVEDDDALTRRMMMLLSTQ